MLNVANKPIMPNVVMMNVIMPNVVAPPPQPHPKMLDYGESG